MKFSKSEVSIFLANIVAFTSYILLQVEVINLFIYSIFVMTSTLLSVYCGIVGKNRGLLYGQIPWILINSYFIIKDILNGTWH